MDDSVQAASRAFSGQTVSVAQNKNVSSILSEHRAASVSNDNKDRGREDATWKCPYVFLFSFRIKHGFCYSLLENIIPG